MVDWKEEMIEKYLKVERIKKGIEQDMTSDVDLFQLKTKMDILKQQIRVEERGYNIRIENVNAQLQHIKEEMIERWDIEDKSFKCDEGGATLRTTKSLVITNNSSLIERLTEILGSMAKACDCIRTFELSTIRKYMDADLIDGCIAHYDEKKNVVINATKNGGDGRDEE